MLRSNERHHMKLKDKSIEKERKREIKLESGKTQDNSPTQIIKHFSHPHPLIYVLPDYVSFSCSSCTRTGRGKRYHCSECNFDIHKICAHTPVTWLLRHKLPREIATFGVRFEVITSFAHPHQDLVTEYKAWSYMCDHCNNSGNGLRFCCNNNASDVAFHQVCAKNPTRLTTYLHPEHELELKLRPYFKKCDLCRTTGPTNNLMYICKKCKFYLHPECSEWPLYLAHPLHPPHPLVLKPCVLHPCSACRGLAQGYKYSCKLCGLDFDLLCIWKHTKFGQGEEVMQKYAGHHEMNVLPVTNLTLPDISQFLTQVPEETSGLTLPVAGTIAASASGIPIESHEELCIHSMS